MFAWLANWFASPWVLSGLALAGAPILIHLLYRRKLRETSWAAMRFLLEAARKNSRRMRIEQLLLLAVRTLLILLAVLALAEPLVNRAGSLFQAGMPVHRIVVIDSSASMAAEPGAEPLFAQARRIAREIVERSRRGDALNLVRLSSLPPRVIVQTPAYSAPQVLEELDRLEVSPAPAALVTGLEEVIPLLRQAPEIRRKEIYLISDFQRATWDSADGDAAARLRGRLKQISEGGQLLLIDVGQPGMSNVGITRIESLDPVVIAGLPARVRVSVRNYGNEPLADRDLQLWVDDRLVDRRALSLSAGAEATEVFSPVVPTAGGHRIEARLGTDVLATDNRRWLSIEAKERLRVLCVTGGGSGRTLRRATDFLALALAPAKRSAAGSTREQPGFLDPTVVDEGQLATIDLSLFDCVYFCNVRRFSEREVATLTRFLKQGGGAVFCSGDQVQTREYNDVLYGQGQGILPAQLGERRGDPGRRDSLFRFDPGSFSHPLVGAFQGNPDAGLESTVTYAYLATSGIAEGNGRVAL
ncbi:MAG: VWA domain-containing protein, partial [Planctomycetaceae bacterium]